MFCNKESKRSNTVYLKKGLDWDLENTYIAKDLALLFLWLKYQIHKGGGSSREMGFKPKPFCLPGELVFHYTTEANYDELVI